MFKTFLHSPDAEIMFSSPLVLLTWNRDECPAFVTQDVGQSLDLGIDLLLLDFGPASSSKARTEPHAVGHLLHGALHALAPGARAEIVARSVARFSVGHLPRVCNEHVKGWVLLDKGLEREPR